MRHSVFSSCEGLTKALTKKGLRRRLVVEETKPVWPNQSPDEEGIETEFRWRHDYGCDGLTKALTKKGLRRGAGGEDVVAFGPNQSPDEEGIETPRCARGGVPRTAA